MKIMLVSGHYYESKRKAGFHRLARAFSEMGHEIYFVTAPISYMSVIKKDHKFQYPLLKEKNKLKKVSNERNVYSYVFFTLFHAGNLQKRILNKLSVPIFKYYGSNSMRKIKNIVREMDLIIFESTPALLLMEKFKKINSTAKYVYRVSDDIRFLHCHPMVIEEENKIKNSFDLISVTCKYVKDIFGDGSRVHLHYHGIDKDVYDLEYDNPYLKEKNAIFVGNSHFDYNFLKAAANALPDVSFHIIGPIEEKVKNKNIIYYGEMPFHETIKYVKNADFGLANRTYEVGSESLTDTLKILQYSYCNIPVIAPSYLKTQRENTFYYNIEKLDNVKEVFDKAEKYSKRELPQFDTNTILSWHEVALSILKEVEFN
ncbi:hypothetical protein ABEY43_13020 [Priestia megaterium]